MSGQDKPKPIPGAGHCEPGNIKKALKLASESSPAFSYVPPPARWDAPRVLTLAERSSVYSLVKAAKCPTNAKARESFENRQAFLAGRVDRMKKTGEVCEIPISDHEHQRQRVPHGTPGAFCITESRAWAGEYRIRTQVDCTTKDIPPDNTGPRITRFLSDRGLTALTDAAAYVSAIGEAFTTFVTLTFSDEARERLATGETSIQREASRCFDAWSKMYRRGMKREGVAGNDDDFRYLWVVEVPDNAQGEPNPHLHVLMTWAVPYEKFEGWAARLESAWGQGFAHLEKIKNGKSAGAYIAKAIGYLCKAQGKSDQGEVRGNRYGISAAARAPGWETLSKTQIDCMGQLISDVYDHLTVTHGPDYRERKKLNRAKQEHTEKAKAYKKKTGTKKAPDWMTRQKKRIDERLEAVRGRLDALPVRANRYQVILKSTAAYNDFMAWAENPGFKPWVAPWLPEKPSGVAFDPGRKYGAGQGHFFKALKKRFQWAKMKRQAVTDEVGAMIDEARQASRSLVDELEAWACYQFYSDLIR